MDGQLLLLQHLNVEAVAEHLQEQHITTRSIYLHTSNANAQRVGKSRRTHLAPVRSV